MRREAEGFHYMTLRMPGVSTALDKAGCFYKHVRSVVFVNPIREVGCAKGFGAKHEVSLLFYRTASSD